YLEIGVAHGDCFLYVDAPTKIGVDPYLKLKQPKKSIWSFRKISQTNNTYCEISSDAFFESTASTLIKEGIDVALVDGLHTHEQSLKDVINCLKLLKDNGVIVMHDCNPSSEIAANPLNPYEHGERLGVPNWKGPWNGDVWKTIAYLRSLRNDLNIFVLDCDYGLGIITKGKPENMLRYSKEALKKISYKDLANDRNNILNLKKTSHFKKFTKTLHSHV
ncbi:hypothetical protein A3J44_06260, partial [candidate division WOR-1 bacterium RIFCSPHIGHO2_02_FULL_45_12]